MEHINLTLLLRKKLIQIKGKIQPKDEAYAQFLSAHCKPAASPLLCLAQRLQYQGCELQQNLILTLIVIIAQTYNVISHSNNTPYSISTIISILYALIFCCLLNFKYEMLVQLAFFALLLGLLILLLNLSIIELQLAIGLVISFGVVLIAKAFVYFEDYLYSDTPNYGFSFQSNLIISLHLFWKIYQIVVLTNYSSLLSTIIALAFINTIKIYKLFDYNVLSVVTILCDNTNTQSNGQNQNSIELPQTVNLFVQTKQEPKDQSNQTNSELKQQNVQNMDIGLQQIQQESVNDFKLSEKKYESNRRTAITIIMMLAFISQIILLVVNKSSSNQSSILLFFFSSSCSTLFVLMVCEYEKTIRNCEKQLSTYIIIYGVDLILIIGSAVVAYFHTNLNYDFATSIFFSIAPFLAIKQFNHFSGLVHLKLNNSKYSSFFLLFLLPFCIRFIALYQQYKILLYFIDGFIYSYSLFVVGLWSNKAQIMSFVKQIKSILSTKKQKLRIFDKLKHLSINYTNLVQTYIYIHVIFLNIMYSLTSFTDIAYQVQFFIIYFAPLFLYFVSLINTYKFHSHRAESYSPYLLNVVVLVITLAYVILSYLNILNGNHYSYSLQVLLNVFLFVVLTEGQKIAIINLFAYSNFIRVLLLTAFFIFIYFPFIAVFTSFYFFTNFSQQYFYYFSLSGFFFLWVVITVTGISIHLVLNLTEKSKKDLFIAQYMENQLGKIGLKEDIEKFLMISNMYEILNEKSEPLLKYLKQEKNVKVIIHRQKDISYDYELVQPDILTPQHRLSIISKAINPLELFNLIKNNHFPQNQQVNTQENPVFTYFKQKQKNRIEIIKPIDVNNGLIELKRMAESIVRKPIILKNIERTQQFKQMQAANEQKVAELMSRFYHFLSQPSECISRQTFSHLMMLLTKQESSSIQQTNKVYNRFGESSLISQYKFKKFIIDYVEYKYNMKNDKPENILKTFCCYEIVPLLQAKFKQFEYHLKRKRIEFTPQKRKIWLNNGDNEQNMQEFREYKLKEIKKKQRILNHIVFKTTKRIDNDDDIPSLQGTSIEQKKDKPTHSTLHQQLKNKTFLKPQNIYAIIVNSLIECYIYYEKESQNFKITTIKCSVSNILAIVTKIIDIIFVFGYSTVYLLIAYYSQNFTPTTYALSSVNYLILIILTGLSTFIYIALIFYHKKDFQMGTLGLDDQRRSLSICDFKFFTTSFLFLLGSALANYIISIALNSFLCNQQTESLYNFSSVQCYSNTQYIYLFVSLLILIIYWPLSAITFPFSTAMDRSLQIKYKSQFQIVYLQFKFLINGYNTLLVVFGFQVSQLIISILKVGICCILAILYMKLQPCSYELMNKIQGKVYILLTILSFAGTLCYFVGILYSVMITGSFIVLYLVYFIYVTIKSYRQLKNQHVQDDIIQDNIKNQHIKIKIIRDNCKNNSQTSAMMKSVLSLKNEEQTSNVKLIQQTKKSALTLQGKITSYGNTRQTTVAKYQ